MGMASAARQKQMQPQPGQRPQLGGGKGRPNPAQQPVQQPQGGFGGLANQIGTQMGGLQPMQPQPQPAQLGGGKGQPGTPSNVPAYAQPYIGNMMNNEQPPVPTMQPPSPLGAAMGGLGGGKGQPSQMGGLSGMGDLQRLAPNTQPYGGSYQEYASSPTQELKMSEEQWNAQQVGIPEQQGGSYNRGNVPQYAQDLFRQLQGQQLAPGAVAPTQAEIERLRPMLSTPGNMPLQTLPQPSLQPAPAPAPALAPAPVAAAPKPFVSQPVQKESPRQAAQRRMQQMAKVKRGFPGGLR